MNKISDEKQLNSETRFEAIEIARDKTSVAKWGLNSVIFLFALLIIIIILVSQDLGVYFAAIVAIVGLATVWVTGWRRGKKLFQHFYYEEISNQKEELGEKASTFGIQLTHRELQILTYAANGYSNKQIASELGIGVSTVKTFISKIFNKLNATDRTHAVVIALKYGLISV